MFSVSPIPTLSLHHSYDDTGVLQSVDCRPFIFRVPLGACGTVFTLCAKRDMIILEITLYDGWSMRASDLEDSSTHLFPTWDGCFHFDIRLHPL